MATVRRPRYSLRDSLYWDETECLAYYGMLSLHEMFEVVGSQLTETDVEVLSFLLDETYPEVGRPLDPAGWTSELCEEDPEASKEEAPSPALLAAWRRVQFRSSTPACPTDARHKPKSGLELLLELERRGYLSESTLEPLLQLLRVLTRHDLLPLVSRKKRRTVSPERFRLDYVSVDRRAACPSALTDTCAQTASHEDHSTQQWRRGVDPARTAPAPLRKKRGKGRRWTSKPVAHKRTAGIAETPPPPVPEKATCG
ncbi:hypothetical protein DPEC_G00144250 [Dallia pectoralis]|uniref:Uncharacterized protein n=1 Tax=Dallia pectoralis TaxID=75939 RepID=A0ACC2GNK6_DALPE|nr:hypothetical protein DPEC_G00144250 [Dallia pectoralis]